MTRKNTLQWLVVCLSLVFTAVLNSGVSQAQAGGAVFVNANTASNQLWMYKRATNGTLSLVGAFPTQGTGGGSGGLSSQGAVALGLSNKFVYVVNAASNDITGFQITATGLTFVGKVPSGGTYPNSIAIFGSLLYVLNAQGTAANISAFRIQSNGALRAISNSSRPLSASLPKPGQVGFSPDGKTLVVSEIGTSVLDTYVVGTDGRATGPTVIPSAGSGPFGFAFDKANHLVVSEVTLSSISSYNLSGGALTVATGALLDFGKAACWAINTNNPNFPQQYSYITNTGNDTVTGVAIATNGTISLLNSDGRTAVLLPGAFPLDMAISRDSRYLYVLEGHLPGVAVFQINSNGSLVQVQDLRGIPNTSYGVIGY